MMADDVNDIAWWTSMTRMKPGDLLMAGPRCHIPLMKIGNTAVLLSAVR